MIPKGICFAHITPQRVLNHDKMPTLHQFGLPGRLPEFASISFRRIVQTPGGISMFYDVGQGQGWQRTIVMDGSPHFGVAGGGAGAAAGEFAGLASAAAWPVVVRAQQPATLFPGLVRQVYFPCSHAAVESASSCKLIFEKITVKNLTTPGKPYPDTTEAGFMKVNDNAGSQRVAE
jgi:hypothetical protein